VDPLKHCNGICVPLSPTAGVPCLSKSHQLLFEYNLQRIDRTLKLILYTDAHNNLMTTAATVKHPATTTKLMRQCQVEYLNHIRGRVSVTSMLDTTAAMEELDYLDGL